jgi:hypothetical protein
MLEHPHESWVNARSRFMIKYFFFSYLDSQERLILLEKRLKVCQLQLEKKELEIASDDPYQLEAWRRYNEEIQDEIKWLSSQIAGCFQSQG